ncbi:hypothetical protein QF035_000372 [Streptomyces umbrinus]|uniref:Uncharacterized protein n=1 Tax=Streptomyces umbrinus TaxID=67370 RepID=A0ABU0SGT9_9ACTN|nr:hypothetical protein [Streptomyces umbrinus]
MGAPLRGEGFPAGWRHLGSDRVIGGCRDGACFREPGPPLCHRRCAQPAVSGHPGLSDNLGRGLVPVHMSLRSDNPTLANPAPRELSLPAT